jgi:hypothetical protein
MRFTMAEAEASLLYTEPAMKPELWRGTVTDWLIGWNK